MKCSECGNQMEEGILVSDGKLWQPWKSYSGLLGSKAITTWRCGKCGKVELRSELDTE